MEGELDFYFSEWCFLARIDPDAFERRRLQLIEDFLSRSGRHKPRLEKLQATIDRDREEAPSAAEALVVLSRKMCDSLWLLEEELKELSDDLRRLELSSHIGSGTWSRHTGTARRYSRCLKQKPNRQHHASSSVNH